MLDGCGYGYICELKQTCTPQAQMNVVTFQCSFVQVTFGSKF